jgi:hypothetical protein
MDDFKVTNDEIRVLFSREPQEGLVSNLASEGDITEDEAWEKVSGFFEGLLDQDVETEVSDFIQDELKIQSREFKSLWGWKHENGKLETASNEELTFIVYRDYFNSYLERQLTDEEWRSLAEVFQGAVQHDHEVDLHYAELEDFLDQ